MQIGQTAVVQKPLQLPLVTVTYDPKLQKFEYHPATLSLVKHETMIAGRYIALIATTHLRATFASYSYFDRETPEGLAVMVALDPTTLDMWTREGMVNAANDLLVRREMHVVVPIGLDGKPVREVTQEMATKAREMILESLKTEHKREEALVTPTGEPKLSGDVGIGMSKMATGGAQAAEAAAATAAGVPSSNGDAGHAVAPTTPITQPPPAASKPDF